MKQLTKQFRRVFITSLRYLFKPIGFFQKIRLDFEDLILQRKLFILKLKDFNIEFDSMVSMGIFNEIFNIKNHIEIKNNNNVLDLGGYYGESALDLSLRNKNIDVFEPENNKFVFLEKNISQRKNIKAFKYAVVADDSKEMKIYKRNNQDGRSSKEKSFNNGLSETVKCIHIKNVLKNNYDALKCDIEGGEFPLIEYFIKHPQDFNFIQGVMELHFWKGNDYNLGVFLQFINFLKQNNYQFYFFDGPKKRKFKLDYVISKIKKLKTSKKEFLPMMYFEKQK